MMITKTMLIVVLHSGNQRLKIRCTLYIALNYDEFDIPVVLNSSLRNKGHTAIHHLPRSGDWPSNYESGDDDFFTFPPFYCRRIQASGHESLERLSKGDIVAIYYHCTMIVDPNTLIVAANSDGIPVRFNVLRRRK